MISIKFEEREKIGLQYALETLHGCSPFGQERIRRLRFYAPEERAALEEELYNVEQAANAAGELKDVYNKLMTGLCQMKDIRNSLRRCADGETPDHVELFEIKGYLQRLEGIRPLFAQINEVTHFRGMAFHDVKAALAILDPDGTGSRGFYIPDSATAKLKEVRRAKKDVEECLFHAQTDAEKDELRLKRTRLCAEEEAEEMHVRRAMGAALAPMVDDLLADADTAGRLDFIIQKALFAVRYGGVRPELTERELELEDMVNPELCDLLAEQGRRFVPVSIRLEPGATVITGANMGGKSVAMKTVALNVLLLQAGFLVCAKKAKMPLFSSVKMLFDDLQSIQSGLRLRLGDRAVPEGADGGGAGLLPVPAGRVRPGHQPGRGRGDRAGGDAVSQRSGRHLAADHPLRQGGGVRPHALPDHRPAGHRPGGDPPGAGGDQRGRRDGDRAAHELRPVQGGGQVRLPAGCAEHLPHAVAEAGDHEDDRGEILMHHRGGRFRPPRFLPFRAGARRSLHRRDCFFRLT